MMAAIVSRETGPPLNSFIIVTIISLSILSIKFDYLEDFKENIVLGRVVPVGTGMFYHKERDVKIEGEE
jgi:hypothetical protein